MTLPTHSGSHILVAVADPAESGHFCQLLGSWGHTPEPLFDGLAALSRLSDPDGPSIALLDADLPRFNGLEIVGELRRRSRRRPFWSMVLCDAPRPDQVLMANDAGVDDFLAKPVSDLDLFVRINTAQRVQGLHADLHESIEAVRFHASHDALTSLLNREAMLGQLFQETDRVQRMHAPLALLLLDLDDFGEVNASFGYSAGDSVLQQLALRFRRCLRSYDLVSRCGEDEFLIALPGCTAAHAVSMAERLLQNIVMRPFQVREETIQITGSFGLAQSRGRSPLVVLREAERALALAKQAGSGSIHSHEPPPTELPESSSVPPTL